MAHTLQHIGDDYLFYLSVERGASPLTVKAYKGDLADYLGYLESRGIDDMRTVTRETVVAYEDALSVDTFAENTNYNVDDSAKADFVIDPLDITRDGATARFHAEGVPSVPRTRGVLRVRPHVEDPIAEETRPTPRRAVHRAS